MQTLKSVMPRTTISIALLVCLSLFLESTPMTTRLPLPPSGAIPEQLFGMHIHRADSQTPWPEVQFGAWRIWDAGVSWNKLQPKPGAFVFDKLDRDVQLASEHNVRVLLTLGISPTWASSEPENLNSSRTPGGCAPPKNLADWHNYVETVARRYKGRIEAYEIWNEPNLPKYFCGSVAEMVNLAREAYKTIKAQDPAALVVAPPGTGRDGIRWLSDYLKAGGGEFSDVIGFHLYVTPAEPEKLVDLTRDVLDVMKANGISKPLWNTEFGWAKPRYFSNQQDAASFVARSYILSWASGVRRLYWYAWDNNNWVTLHLADPNSLKPEAAAAAYSTIQKWLVGGDMQSLTMQPDGTWICVLSRGGVREHIVWNPDATVQLSVPRDWHVSKIENSTGVTSQVPNSGTLQVHSDPLLLGSN